MDDEQEDFDEDEEMGEDDQGEEGSEDDARMDGSESPLDLGTVPNGHSMSTSHLGVQSRADRWQMATIWRHHSCLRRRAPNKHCIPFVAPRTG